MKRKIIAVGGKGQFDSLIKLGLQVIETMDGYSYERVFSCENEAKGYLISRAVYLLDLEKVVDATNGIIDYGTLTIESVEAKIVRLGSS